MAISKAIVIGGGQMGLGIAYVSAVKAGYNTTLVDSSEAALAKATKFHDHLLHHAVKRGDLTAEQAKAAKARILTSTSIPDALKDADFVFEAVPENLAIKQDVLKQFVKYAPKHSIFATNTSSISITKIAAAAGSDADRVVGVHFFIPVPKQPGVEVIRGLLTSDKTHEIAVDVVERLGKIPSTVVDTPGFIANRILGPYMAEAIHCLETGLASAEDIDSIMVNACGMPIGPLRLADFIGLDTVLAVGNVVRDATGDPTRKSVYIQRLVDAGHLGIKTGRGIYNYNKTKL